jgi:hypothetical protein
MALRGNCSFAEKALLAQVSGAKAIVVGDDRNEPLVRMGTSNPNNDSIHIPAVFIGKEDYEEIYLTLETSMFNEKFKSQSHTSGLNPDDPTLSTKTRKLVSGNKLVSVNSVKALLNDKGEAHATDQGATEKIRIAGFFLLSVPALWCTLSGAYLIRRHIAERISRYRRSHRAADIPLVTYRQMPQEENHDAEDNTSSTGGSEGRPRSSSTSAADSSPAATGNSTLSFAPSSFFTSAVSASPKIHNESCAICLDDFKEGSSIKVLPCQHGFHSPCIDPWLNERSDLCPICKKSILVSHNHLSQACCLQTLCCSRPQL